MKAVFKRELRSYFVTMTGYMFLAMFLLAGGLFFWLWNLSTGATAISDTFENVKSWAVFILPVLTMRMFAEDRRLKTDQMLLTAPVSVRSIVMGKFLAAASVVTGAVLIIMVYYSVIFGGSVNWPEALVSAVGFVLLCFIILSIGGFMSALTDSMIVAAFSTYGILTVTVLMGNIAKASPEALKNVLLWLSPTERYSAFWYGVLDPAVLVYYISLTVLFLALTAAVTERRRFS